MSSYLTVDDAGSTITVTCPDDELTFTVATENAWLKQSNPLQVWISDDSGDYWIYPNGMMFYYGTNEGSGLSGNDYSENNITGDWFWYPLNSTNETNQSAITTALQDQDIAAPTTGTIPTDFNIPYQITDFLADGTIPFVPDGSNEVKFTFDRTRYNQAISIHPETWRYWDGSAVQDALVFWDKMD